MPYIITQADTSSLYVGLHLYTINHEHHDDDDNKTQNSGDSGVVGDENKWGTRYYITMWRLSHARMKIITVNDVCW